MSRTIAVLRPQPGNARTATGVTAMGYETIALPLFAMSPIAWTPPAIADHDALMLTSANAVRHAGAGLAVLRGLPVLAVGARTAEAAMDVGFTVALAGTQDAAALIDQAQAEGYRRILHLGGRETTIAPGGAVLRSIAVYASDPLPVAAADIARLRGSVALLHSARAARHLATLVSPSARADIRLAALSPAILAAAGPGWGDATAAATPTDAALLACAHALAGLTGRDPPGIRRA